MIYGVDLTFSDDVYLIRAQTAGEAIERMRQLEELDHYIATRDRIAELFPHGRPDLFGPHPLPPTFSDHWEADVVWHSLHKELEYGPGEYPRWRRVIARWEAKHRGPR